MNFNLKKVYLEFIFWLRGIIEDDPIPYEIKSLVFFINKNYEIGFSGAEEENIKTIYLNFYFPLEAEYFFSVELYDHIFSNKNKKETSLNILESLLKKLKNDNYFKKFNLYFGLLNKSAKKIN